MKEQIKMFLKYFLSIQDGTNERIRNSRVKSVVFNPKFHAALIKAQYIKSDDVRFRGYPFSIDDNDGADYWGLFLESNK